MSDLSEREKFELQVRTTSVQVQLPYGFTPDTKLSEVISNADKISKFILNGDIPDTPLVGK
jgi:hypothetical protein